MSKITLTTDWKEILPGVEMRITAPAFYLSGVEAEIRFTDAVRRYYPDFYVCPQHIGTGGYESCCNCGGWEKDDPDYERLCTEEGG